VILGIVIHVVGSVGINIGQNIQAMALDALGDQQHKPWKSKLWVIGMVTFGVSSIVTFGALALASASILVPLESVQFVVNIAFNKIIRKKSITPKMYAGVVMIMAGIALFVIFGPNEGVCFAEPELRGFWTSPTWWVYMIVTFAIALVAYIVWRRYNLATRQGKPMAYANVVEPAAFTLSSALFGGGQMIVHTKLLAELLELNAAAGELALANWFFWLELFLTALFGIYWLFRLSQCLGMYDPLFIIPLMQTAFIIFGAIAGGIYFQEFALMVGAHSYVLYTVGILFSVGGLCLLASGVPPPNVPNKVPSGLDGTAVVSAVVVTTSAATENSPSGLNGHTERA
jgi:uncharacterized membrane protein